MSWVDALFRSGTPQGRTIPTEEPRLAWEVEVPGTWAGHLEAPVVSNDGLVLCAAGAGETAVEALVAIDVASGAVRWRLALPEAPSRDFSTGLPLALEDGGAIVPAYWQDEELSALRASREGALAARHVIGSADDPDAAEKDIVSYDSGIKTFLAPAIAAGDGGYLVSWLYRQVRNCRMECRALESGARRWEAREWLVAATGSVVLGQENDGLHQRDRTPERAFRFHARDAADGRERWWRDPSRFPTERIPRVDTRPLAAMGSLFVLRDRTAMESARAAREEEILELMVGQPDVREQAIETWERNHPLGAGEDLIALDAETGAERWRVALPGEVAGVAAGERVIAVISLAEAGAIRLHRFDAAGTVIGETLLGDVGFRRAAGGALPRLVAIDHTSLVWERDGEAVCEPIADPGRVVWRTRIDCGASFRPRVADRLAVDEPAAVAWGGAILARSGDVLRCWRS